MAVVSQYQSQIQTYKASRVTMFELTTDFLEFN